MSPITTLTVARLKENITESRSTMTAATQPSMTRLKCNLTETKRQILSNISDALKNDIELKRRELRAVVAAETSSTTFPAPTSPSQPALEFSRQPDYCAYRPPRRSSGFFYHTPSLGRPCVCESPHLLITPRQWTYTPAEEKEWDHTLPNGGHAERSSKVSFKPDPVKEVKVFERWYQDEYEFSDRYWGKGAVRVTEDWSSVEDDDFEIEFLEAAEAAGGLEVESYDEEGEGEGDGDGDRAMDDFDFDNLGDGKDADGGPLARMA